MMKLLFLDCETTGLDPVIHVPWEVAAVLAEHTDDGRLIEIDSVDMMLAVKGAELAVAHPVALAVGRFHDRYWEHESGFTQIGAAAAAIDALCDDRPHLIGAVPSFDDRRVGDMMRRCGITPRWHYHLIDVEALAVGWCAGFDKAERAQPSAVAPWKSDDLSRQIGVDPDKFDRHTAMGDVRWAMAQYAAVFGLIQEAHPTERTN